MSDDIGNKKNLSERYPKTQFAIASIIVYLLLSQFVVAIAPEQILNEYLSRHTIVQFILLLAIYMLSLGFRPRINNTIGYKNLLLYMALGIIVCVIANYPYSIINKLHDKPNEYIIFMKYGTFAKAYFIFSLVILGPIIEEIFYRLYIYSMLKEEMSIAYSTVISAALYMLMHGKIQIVYLFIPGVVYALVYEKTKTIWSSVVVHGLNNLVWFSLVYYA
jgi:membrane protease YdiL (CAAX protease family)